MPSPLEMGGLMNGIYYVAGAVTVGYLLKSTDYISYKIDERCVCSQRAFPIACSVSMPAAKSSKPGDGVAGETQTGKRSS